VSAGTVIDTACDPALPMRNCIDHPADCNPFQKCNPIPDNSAINREIMIPLRCARRDNLFNGFFGVPALQLQFAYYCLMFAPRNSTVKKRDIVCACP